MRDIDEIRRENLGLIERELGGPNEAAKLIGMSASQFTNLRKGAKDSKTGKPRGMHKDTARKIENRAGKPLGWLDVEHSQNAPDAGHSAHSTPSLAAALEVLPQSLLAANDLTVDQVRPLLMRLLNEPNRAQEICPRLLSLLSETGRSQHSQPAPSSTHAQL